MLQVTEWKLIKNKTMSIDLKQLEEVIEHKDTALHLSAIKDTREYILLAAAKAYLEYQQDKIKLKATYQYYYEGNRLDHMSSEQMDEFNALSAKVAEFEEKTLES